MVPTFATQLQFVTFSVLIAPSEAKHISLMLMFSSASSDLFSDINLFQVARIRTFLFIDKRHGCQGKFSHVFYFLTFPEKNILSESETIFSGRCTKVHKSFSNL